MNDSPTNNSLSADVKDSLHGQCTSDTASSHGETSSDNEMLESETDSDDDWEGCEATHIWWGKKVQMFLTYLSDVQG